jgi:hypothetical protein
MSDNCLIERIEKCYDFGSLYILKEDLHKIGLTIHPTVSNKMVLCKIVDGRPSAEQLTEDFIFVGHKLEPDYPIPDRLLKCVVEFVQKNTSDAAEIIEQDATDFGSTSMYGETITIESEDMRNLAQQISIEDKLTADDLLGAIKEWLDNNEEL